MTALHKMGSDKDLNSGANRGKWGRGAVKTQKTTPCDSAISCPWLSQRELPKDESFHEG